MKFASFRQIFILTLKIDQVVERIQKKLDIDTKISNCFAFLSDKFIISFKIITFGHFQKWQSSSRRVIRRKVFNEVQSIA